MLVLERIQRKGIAEYITTPRKKVGMGQYAELWSWPGVSINRDTLNSVKRIKAVRSSTLAPFFPSFFSFSLGLIGGLRKLLGMSKLFSSISQGKKRRLFSPLQERVYFNHIFSLTFPNENSFLFPEKIIVFWDDNLQERLGSHLKLFNRNRPEYRRIVIRGGKYNMAETLKIHSYQRIFISSWFHSIRRPG